MEPVQHEPPIGRPLGIAGRKVTTWVADSARVAEQSMSTARIIPMVATKMRFTVALMERTLLMTLPYPYVQLNNRRSRITAFGKLICPTRVAVAHEMSMVGLALHDPLEIVVGLSLIIWATLVSADALAFSDSIDQLLTHRLFDFFFLLHLLYLLALPLFLLLPLSPALRVRVLVLLGWHLIAGHRGLLPVRISGGLNRGHHFVIGIKESGRDQLVGVGVRIPAHESYYAGKILFGCTTLCHRYLDSTTVVDYCQRGLSLTEFDIRSGLAILNSAISGNSGPKVWPRKAGQEGVFDGQEIRAADAPPAHGGVQGPRSIGGVARGSNASRAGRAV